MEYLDNIGEKVGLGNVDLDNIKRQASFYLRDKFKSARLLLTDVTPSQLLAEEATNDDEWGPATKTMTAISDACRRPDECPRIMLVLHSRLALIGKKHWRQFLKTLTVVEFLLFHGPEQLGMEFSSDRDLIEDLTRFNYVSERGVDHGLVVRKKAKQVLKLLMEDDYLKEERARAQKLTKSIFGQGSYQSSSSGSGTSRYGGFGNTSSSSASTGLMHDDDTDEYHSDKKFTAFEERILSEKRGSRQEKTKNGNGESTANDWRAFDDDTGSFLPNQNAAESNWADFSNTSPERSPKFDGPSPFARQNELLEDESFSPRSPASIGKSSVQNSPKLPVKVVKEEPKPKGKSKLKVRNYTLSTSASGDFKLPPPPPPPGGSKVMIVKSVSAPLAAQPDLLDLSFDASDSHREESLLNFGTPPKAAAGSDQAVMDLLGMTSSTPSVPSNATSLPSEFDFLTNNTSGNNKVPETRSPGLVPDIFDLGSNSTADSGSLPVNTADSVKDRGPFGGFDFLNLNNESSTTGSEQDFFGTGVASAAPNSSTTGSEQDFFGTGVASAAPNSSTTGSEQDFFGTGVASASAAPNSSTVNDSDLFVSERSSTGSGAATGISEVVPADVFDAIVPDFASFGLRDTGRKSVAKPADDGLFNLLS